MTTRPMFWNPTLGRMQVLPFRPPRGIQRRPVKGGRWEVRKSEIGVVGHQWQAKSHGKAQHLSRRFARFEDAIDWAQRCAAVYAMKPGTAKDDAYFLLRVEKYGPKHVVKGTFPDRPTVRSLEERREA